VGCGISSTRLARRKRLSVAYFSSWYLALPAPRRTMNNASHPAFMGFSRTASRNRRFTLFLTAALPIRLLTKNPNRLQSKSLARYLITNNRLAALLPSAWIWENRLLPVSRCLRCITGPNY